MENAGNIIFSLIKPAVVFLSFLNKEKNIAGARSIFPFLFEVDQPLAGTFGPSTSKKERETDRDRSTEKKKIKRKLSKIKNEKFI